MADVTYQGLEAHNAVGDFVITLHYDDASLLITSADVVNTTGIAQSVTVGTHTFNVATGTNSNVPLSSFNQFMVNTFKGPRPPLLIA